MIDSEDNTNKLLLFGGVYSNLQALEALKSITESKGFSADQIICNGDIVGYCAQPEQSVQLIKEWGIRCITGNVEIQLREGENDCGCDFENGSRCDTFSRKWYPYAQQQMSENSIQWMKQLPEFLEFELGTKKISIVHGTKKHASQYLFKSTPWSEKQKEFDESQLDIIVGGHSGLPFTDQQNNHLWINPGVIGMPANNASTDVWYAILTIENTKAKVEHFHFSYDHQKAANLMLEKSLPREYAQTLLTGLWDNCEILPEEETKNQGKEIVF